MENLERLTSSVAQVELLVASLKREQRDLASRLAQSAEERRQALDSQEALQRRHDTALEEARAQAGADAGTQERLAQVEADAADAHQRLAEAEALHASERSHWEASLAEAEERSRAQLSEREARITRLESECLDLGRQLNEAQVRLAEAANPDEVARWQSKLSDLEGLQGRAADLEAQGQRLNAEKAELRSQRRELAAFAKERDNLRRRVQELMATLESVRLG